MNKQSLAYKIQKDIFFLKILMIAIFIILCFNIYNKNNKPIIIEKKIPIENKLIDLPDFKKMTKELKGY